MVLKARNKGCCLVWQEKLEPPAARPVRSDAEEAAATKRRQEAQAKTRASKHGRYWENKEKK